MHICAEFNWCPHRAPLTFTRGEHRKAAGTHRRPAAQSGITPGPPWGLPFLQLIPPLFCKVALREQVRTNKQTNKKPTGASQHLRE